MKLFNNKNTQALFSMLLVLFFAEVTPAQIRIGLSATGDISRSGTFVWAKAFSDYLDQTKFQTIIYTNSSLGNEIVRTEQVLLGLLEINVTALHEVAIFSELIGVMDTPFLLQDSTQISRLVDHTDLTKMVNATSLQNGLRLMSYAYSGGMEGLFTTNKAVSVPADMSDLRLRAMNSQQLDYFQAWGSAGTQVAWEEVPQALQTGIADGYLNPPVVAILFGHGSQLDYFTDLRMSPSMRLVVVSEKWYSTLNESERKLIDAAVKYAEKTNRDWNDAMVTSEFKLLEDHGIEIIKINEQQRSLFRNKIEQLKTSNSSNAVKEKFHSLLEKVSIK